jgi:hypothetical protein
MCRCGHPLGVTACCARRAQFTTVEGTHRNDPGPMIAENLEDVFKRSTIIDRMFGDVDYDLWMLARDGRPIVA